MVSLLAFLAGPIGRWLIIGLLVSAFLAAGYHKVKQRGWDEREAVALEEGKEAQRLAAVLAQKRIVISEKVVTVYRDRVQVIEKEGLEVIRYVEKYIPLDTPDLPGGFRLLHDAAITGRFPEGSGGVNGTAPVAVSVATETVVANYATCRANAQQLVSLQEWVSQQEKLQ